MKVRTKWVALVFLGALVAALSAGPAMAEQKMKMKGKRFGVITETTVHPVGDVKGHAVGVTVSEGVDILYKATWRSISNADLHMPQGGTIRGWNITTLPNGDKTYGQFQGKLEGKRGPDGKPMMLLHGTWKFVRGTGKWAGVQGSGTFKGRYLGKKIYTYDLDGEYTIKK
ncbi:MAG: hypothetical protein KQI62_10245 [Deltaproteobacteria bacterium]|nr:hypothetical protein [Deltaproteobacteria bacterium]